LVYYAHGEREKFLKKSFLSPREKNLRANPLLRISFRQDAKTGNSVEIFPEQKTKNCFAVLKTCEVLLLRRRLLLFRHSPSKGGRMTKK
jgi:hypothetical protein